MSLSLPFSLIALDLDGTLLSSTHQISDWSLSVLTRLDSLGVTVAVCTGRSTSTVMPLFRNTGLGSRIYFVTFNGASMVREEKGQTVVVAMKAMETTAVEMAIEFVRNRKRTMNVYWGDKVYAHCYTNEHRELTERYKELTGCEYEYLQDEYESFKEGDKQIPKILVFGQTEELDSLEDEIKSFFGDRVHVTRGFFFVEILHPQVNKGNGLKLLCESIKMPLDRVIAFGDGDNDVEFLKFAGYSVAMRNGAEAAKTIACKVSEKSNDEDGVAHELIRIFELAN